jgi:hydrogenase maturation protease
MQGDTPNEIRPVLVFTWGNPSRGDDALGPALHDLIEAGQKRGDGFGHVDILTDFQLQVEHVLDLQRRRWIVFVDAAVDATPPYDFYRLQAADDVAYTTHAVSPAALLAVYQQVYAQPAPPAFMLSVRGYEFGLGQSLSPDARRHLDEAFAFLSRLPLDPPFDTPDICAMHGA